MIQPTYFLSFRRLLFVLLVLNFASLKSQWLPAEEVEVKLSDGEVFQGSFNPTFTDLAGFLWGTVFNRGAGRYDGETITIYGEEQGVNCVVDYIIQDDKGYIWLMGAPKGADNQTLLRSTLPFTGGIEPNDVRFTDSLPGGKLLQHRVLKVALDEAGQIWMSTREALLRYSYTASNQLELDTLFTDPRVGNSIYFGLGEGEELFVLRGDSVLYSSTIHHQSGEDFVETPLQGQVLPYGDITVKGDMIWVCDYISLVRFPYPSEGLGNTPLVGKGISSVNAHNAPLVFVDDSTLLLSRPDVVLEIDRKKVSIRKEYKAASELNVPTILSLFDDQRGNIWLGTVTGLARMPKDYRAFASPSIKTMGPEAKLEENVTVMVARMGGPGGKWLLIGTSTGLFIRSEGGEWQAIGKEQGLLLPTILGIDADAEGRIWAATQAKGINYLSPPDLVHPQSVRPGALTIFDQDFIASGVSSDFMYSPFVLPLRREAGGSSVLSLWGGNGAIGQVLTEDKPWLWLPDYTGYQGDAITFISQDKKEHLLIASPASTLLRSTEPFTYEYYERLHENVKTLREGRYYESLDSNIFEKVELHYDTATFSSVYSMATIQDELWLGVETGTLVLDLETLETKAFIPMSCEDCQPKDFAHDPARNRIWVASTNGIWEIDADNYRLVRMITEENGLRGNTGFSPQCITVDPEGTIYYATSNGLAAYRPELAKIFVDSFPVYVRQQDFKENSWGKNEVALSFAALDYREAKKVYQTKLEGYDEDWSETTKDATLRYTNLPAYLFPKTYQFRVRSQTDDGGWVENTVPAEIKVSPPWYFSWWAALLGLGLLALAIRQYLQYQLRRQAEALALQEAEVIKEQRDEIKKKNDQNELLLKEIHHRVKNNLEVVSSLLELQSAGLTDSEARDAMQAGQSRVQSMGLLHQKLYQGENLAAIEMKDYFNQLAESLLESYETGDHIEIAVEMDPLELDVDTAVPLGLIVNELLTNAIKYAFAGTSASSAGGATAGAVEVSLSKEKGRAYHLMVKDNGQGKDFTASASGTGFGSRLVDLLTRQLGGTLTEENDGGLTTEVHFEVATSRV